MTLSEWLEGYRRLDVDDFARPVSEREDDWEDPGLIAPEDRVRDTSPRWRERAGRMGYGRVTAF